MSDRIVTYSELSCLFSCPRRHQFQYTRRLVPKRTKIYLDESIGAHHALENFYGGGSVETAIGEFDKIYDAHIAELESTNVNPADAIERFLRVRALLVMYFEINGQKDRENYTFDHVEEEFLVPVYDLNGRPLEGVKFGGKMDGIWSGRTGRKIRQVVEHKFLSQFSDTNNTLMLDLQVTLYALAARTMFGVEVPVTLYNVSRKPQNEMREKESPEDFFNRVIDMIRKKPDSYFSRTPVTRGASDFAEAARLLYHGAMILTGRTPLPYIYRNVGMMCTMLCSYREPCLHETPRMIEDLYQVKKKLHPEISFEEA
jgi:hypothetical protein